MLNKTMTSPYILRNGFPKISALNDCLSRWVAMAGVNPQLLPAESFLHDRFGEVPETTTSGVDPRQIDDWERRHDYVRPRSLRAWLTCSNGFHLEHPLIHPLSAIGPMIPFAKVPELLVQPESWFELGNPNVETVCIDLGYQLPGGGNPIFTSGDDESGSLPRIIAPSFESWFLELLRQGGREYWFDPGFQDLGHPWRAHRRFAPVPGLPERLRPLAERMLPLIRPAADERVIASNLGISLSEVELIFRYLQHGVGSLSES